MIIHIQGPGVEVQIFEAVPNKPSDLNTKRRLNLGSGGFPGPRAQPLYFQSWMSFSLGRGILATGEQSIIRLTPRMKMSRG